MPTTKFLRRFAACVGLSLCLGAAARADEPKPASGGVVTPTPMPMTPAVTVPTTTLPVTSMATNVVIIYIYVPAMCDPFVPLNIPFVPSPTPFIPDGGGQINILPPVTPGGPGGLNQIGFLGGEGGSGVRSVTATQMIAARPQARPGVFRGGLFGRICR